MMKNEWRSFVLYFLYIFTVGAVSSENVYVATGTTYTFKPPVNTFEAFEWRYKGNIAVEWDAKSIPQPHWYKFKGEGRVDIKTGEFTLLMKKEFSGEFSGHFSTKGVAKENKYVIEVMDPVSKPKVTCESNGANRTLVCSVYPPADATFSWTGPNGFSGVGERVLITGETNYDFIYYCTAEYKVSRDTTEFKLGSCTRGAVRSENEYVATGTNYTFKPPVNTFEAFEWRYKGNIAVEWDAKTIPQPFWYKFKDEGRVDIKTGEFTLLMKKEFSGEFSGHFSTKGGVKENKYMIKVMDK